jgi:hypothetical protein
MRKIRHKSEGVERYEGVEKGGTYRKGSEVGRESGCIKVMEEETV